MSALAYTRARDLPEVVALLRANPEARVLAGGQSLLPMVRLGLTEVTQLIDVQDVAELHGLRLAKDHLVMGALCTHAQIARSALVQEHLPWVAQAAARIADAQVREVGTLGGSLANHDPNACWLALALAAQARLETSQGWVDADDFFQGPFTTALGQSGVLVAVHWPLGRLGAYAKFEQVASRFAQPGLAMGVDPRTGSWRVAVTGLGYGAQRWAEAEAALRQPAGDWAHLKPPLDLAVGDVHTSAEYRAHLARVLCRRLAANLKAHLPDNGLADPNPAKYGTPAPPVPAAAKNTPTPSDRPWWKRLFDR